MGEWAELVRSGRLRIVGPIRQELLSGIRSDTQFEQLETALSSFPDEKLDTEDYVEAARCFNLCRSRGVAAAHVDLLLCAVAVRRNWSVFSLDSDFGRLAGILHLRLHGLALA